MTDSPQQRSRSRWKILVAGGLLSIGTAYAYIHFSYSRPMGEGPAGPAVPPAPFQSVWTRRPVLLLGIGDSITAGLGARSPAHSYFQRLIENPADEFPDMRGKCLAAVLPNLESRNLAVSGTTSLSHIDLLEQSLPDQDPGLFGIVVMTTGGNDLIHNYGRTAPREGAMYGATLEEARPWISSYRQRLKRMLEKINHRFPGGCEIFLADIYDPTDGVGDAPSVHLPNWPDGLAIHGEYNRVIYQTVEQYNNVHLVPLHQEFLGHGSHCRQFWRKHYCAEDPHYWFYVNIEDPNNRGYDAIRRLFLLEILQVRERLKQLDSVGSMNATSPDSK
jgi:lysophospholipase L1-like esterase